MKYFTNLLNPTKSALLTSFTPNDWKSRLHKQSPPARAKEKGRYGNRICYQLGFLSTSLGIGLIIATSSSIGSASPIPVDAASSPPHAEIENPVVANSPSVGATHESPLLWDNNAGATQLSQTPSTPQPPTTPSKPAQDLELNPEIIENSPVLQRWQRQIPNVLEEMRNDPSFRTRIRLGYSQFPSTGQAAGFNVGVEDVFIGRTGLTVSGDYQRAFNGKREAYGADLHYYVLPLGSYVNIAPVVGYRNLQTDKYSTDGINVGARLMLALSRTGAADISLTQSFVSPGSNEEVGITTLSVGYAVTRNLRLSTDIQKQNAPQRKDSRVGIVLEWMP